MNNSIRVAKELAKIAKSLVSSNNDDYYVTLKEREQTINTFIQSGYAPMYKTEEEAKQEGAKSGYPIVMKQKDFDAYVEAVRTIKRITEEATGKSVVIKK